MSAVASSSSAASGLNMCDDTVAKGRKRGRDTDLKAKKPKNQRSSSFCSLIPIQAPYSLIEVPAVLCGDKENSVHFYPSDEVRRLYKAYREDSRFTNFQDYLRKLKPQPQLPLPEHTVCYLPRKWLDKYKFVTIKENDLYRYGRPIEVQKKAYIFVIDRIGSFYIASKQRKAKHGRIHHSSLSRGKDVQSAGMVEVKDKPRRHFVFTNLSGHYQPSCENLDVVLSWLRSNGLKFDVKSDTKYTDRLVGLARRIEVVPIVRDLSLD